MDAERVTRAEAARKLGVDKATLTRLCHRNPALLDDEGRVSVQEVALLREAVLHPGLQTRGQGERTAAAPRGAMGLNDQRARAESAKAEMSELDLAERLGLTLRRDDVEAAIAAAGDVMRGVAFSLARDKAEAMARITDVRAMERALEDLMRDVLTRGAQALALAAAPMDATHAA